MMIIIFQIMAILTCKWTAGFVGRAVIVTSDAVGFTNTASVLTINVLRQLERLCIGKAFIS